MLWENNWTPNPRRPDDENGLIAAVFLGVILGTFLFIYAFLLAPVR